MVTMAVHLGGKQLWAMASVAWTAEQVSLMTWLGLDKCVC